MGSGVHYVNNKESSSSTRREAVSLCGKGYAVGHKAFLGHENDELLETESVYEQFKVVYPEGLHHFKTGDNTDLSFYGRDALILPLGKFDHG